MMEDESLNIHGVFKAILGLVAGVAIIGTLLHLWAFWWFAGELPNSWLFIAATLFFGFVPAIIASMAFLSLRKRRGDTIYLLRAFFLFLILRAIAFMPAMPVLGRGIPIIVWTICLLYLFYSKQVKLVFPIEERHSSPWLRLSLCLLSIFYVLFYYRVTACVKNGVPFPDMFYEKVEILIDDRTLKEDEYSDGYVRVKKPTGLKCGTHYIGDEEIITLFNDDCVYYIQSGIWYDDVDFVSDSLLQELAGNEYTKYPHELMSDNHFYSDGEPRNKAHRKCYIFHTEPYITMVDAVLLRDWRTPKYCLVFGKYEEGTGSHTMEIVDAVRFQ